MLKMTRNKKGALKIAVRFILVLFLFTPLFRADAKTPAAPAKPKTPAPIPFEISGWIPYWRTATGTADALAHLDTFKEISPFGFTLKKDGSIFDPMPIDALPWQTLMEEARKKKIRIIPTIMSGNGALIDSLLRSPSKRKAHIKEIVSLVSTYGFDGIDIDYEGKMAKTKKYFSLFLRDLYKAMGKKFVVCSIEARTPLDSRFAAIPEDIQYANDFAAINAYCDRVRIMTYDQGSIDLKLNDAVSGPYVPVADPRWVEKVIRLAAQTISKNKIVIGVPTYGYEFKVTPLTEGYAYRLLWAFNPRYAWDLAKDLSITPERNVAGELSFVYHATTTQSSLPSTESAPSNNATMETAAVIETSNLKTSAASSTPFQMLWWSDANSVRDKMLLAKKLGVRGIAIFKIDGGEDPDIWKVIQP